MKRTLQAWGAQPAHGGAWDTCMGHGAHGAHAWGVRRMGLCMGHGVHGEHGEHAWAHMGAWDARGAVPWPWQLHLAAYVKLHPLPVKLQLHACMQSHGPASILTQVSAYLRLCFLVPSWWLPQ